MTTSIILIALLLISGYLTTLWDYEELGVIMCVIFGLCLIAHSISWGVVGYNYGLFVEKRNAFEQTLIVARENGNEYETATIIKEVARWNVNLAEYKYNNKTLFFGQYIDDRIDTLEPIK